MATAHHAPPHPKRRREPAGAQPPEPPPRRSPDGGDSDRWIWPFAIAMIASLAFFATEILHYT